MITGFEKIVEERIKQAQNKGEFENLPGHGKPIQYEDDATVPEECRLANKILKNAGYLPPQVELRKKIQQTEESLANEKDDDKKYKALKKLNILMMKLNMSRSASMLYDIYGDYQDKLIDRVESRK